MKKTTMLLICVGMIGLLATSGFAALSTTLGNPSFEQEPTGNAAYHSVQQWEEGGGILSYQDAGPAYDAGLIRTMSSAFNDELYIPAETTDGDQIVGIYMPNGSDIEGDNLFIFQSLGTVVAGDVGFVWSLSADYNISGRKASLTGNVVAAFTTGTIAADYDYWTGGLWTPGAYTGVAGTDIGTVGSSAFSVTEARYGEWTWANTGVASYAPSVGDIGTEIFAMVRADMATTTGTHAFGAFDNVVMTVIPEPATLFVLGLGGVLTFLRRRSA